MPIGKLRTNLAGSLSAYACKLCASCSMDLYGTCRVGRSILVWSSPNISASILVFLKCQKELPSLTLTQECLYNFFLHKVVAWLFGRFAFVSGCCFFRFLCQILHKLPLTTNLLSSACSMSSPFIWYIYCHIQCDRSYYTISSAYYEWRCLTNLILVSSLSPMAFLLVER